MTEALNIAPNSIGVFWLDLDADDERLDIVERSLSPDERARVGRLSSPLRRRATVRFVWRRMILSEVCGIGPTDLRIRTHAGGKPYAVDLSGDTVEFSTSHCGDLGLIAVARHRVVGVDVESASELFGSPRVTSWVASGHEVMEIDEMTRANRPSALLRLWTRKEAYLKATGEGIGDGLRHVRVPLGEVVEGAAFSPIEHGPEWLMYSIETPRADLEAALVISSMRGHSTPEVMAQSL
jgi:4'-phosphopantetheinyl transferase